MVHDIRNVSLTAISIAYLSTNMVNIWITYSVVIDNKRIDAFIKCGRNDSMTGEVLYKKIIEFIYQVIFAFPQTKVCGFFSFR